MTTMTRITADDAAVQDALQRAMARASYSYFDQHIIRDEDGRCWVADEGGYESLIPTIRDWIVLTIPAGRSDES